MTGDLLMVRDLLRHSQGADVCQARNLPLIPRCVPRRIRWQSLWGWSVRHLHRSLPPRLPMLCRCQDAREAAQRLPRATEIPAEQNKSPSSSLGLFHVVGTSIARTAHLLRVKQAL